MQTVIFACRQCGKEMAVASEHLGFEVRCPHCQQVVAAPAGVPTAVPAVEPTLLGAAPSRASDSIFDAPAEHEESASDSAGTTTAFLPSEGDTANGGAAHPKSDDPTTEFLFPEKGPRTVVAAPASAATVVVDASTAAFTREQATPPRNRLTGYLLAILVPYAILMTLAAIWFFLKSQQTAHPLEALPDWPRDNEPPARSGASFQRVDDSAPLPARLRVALGGTLSIGDLAVTPRNVERRPVLFRYERSARREEQSRNEALLLTLHVRNLSTEGAFAPNDPFFNRKWRDGMPPASRPYTCLEIGKTRFYGGPCEWKPRRPGTSEVREFVAGSEHDRTLGPAAEMDYVVCTDPDNTAVLAAVADHAGALQWRVQLRCGFGRGRLRQDTFTAVIGVDFVSSDVQ